MASAHEFNDRFLKALRPRQHAYREFAGSDDPDDRGLGVLVTPSGTLSFFLSYTGPKDKRRKEYRLGIYPATTLREARTKARQLRYRIRDGADPVEEQRQAREAERAVVEAETRASKAPTVKDVCDSYVKMLRAEKRRAADQAARIFAVEVLPVLGTRKARTVTPGDVTDLIAGIADRGKLILANRTRSWLRAAFQFAIDAPSMPKWRSQALDVAELTGNPVAATKRAQRHEAPSDRYLSVDELRAVWRALDAPYAVKRRGGSSGDVLPDRLHALALKLLLSTGQRVEEVLGAQWSEFDLDAGEWTIPGARRKTRGHVAEAHLVPLAPFHVALLTALKACPDTGATLLFPDPEGQPRKPGSLGQFVRRLCTRIQVPHFAPRDSRRTFKTLAGKAGIDLELRNRLQGHALQDVGSRHYDRYGYIDEKREAMQRWATWLAAATAPA